MPGAQRAARTEGGPERGRSLAGAERAERFSAVRRAAPTALLVSILAVGAALRLAGLDWDGGLLFHPDERRILMAVRDVHWPRGEEWSLVLGPRSPLNPRFFAYGSLPIYLLRLLQAVLGVDVSRLYLPARAWAAACDLLTVGVVYAVGRRSGGRRTGLLAAAFLAVAVLPLQLAHFATVEPLLTLLSALAVCALLRVAESGSLRAGLAAGALTGLALATKTSALPLLGVAWVAWAVWAIRARPAPRLGRGLAGLALGCAATAVAFVVAEPYALLDWFRFVAALAREGAMVRGAESIPYTRQYANTLPYLYHLRELVLWSLGPPLGLLALAAVAWLSWRGLRRRRADDLVLLSWLWGYWLAVGGFQVKFSRYMAPLIPWLCLGAALLLVRLRERARRRQPARWAVLAVGGGVLALTLAYAVAFAGLYQRPHPWQVVSERLCREVPPGAILAVEVWDDALPARPDAACAARYEHLRLDLYAPDDGAKLDRLVEALGTADYIILASQRLYASIGRLPDEYPLTSAYYRLLFAEQLGFELESVTTNYPRLGPLALVDEPLVGTPLPRPELLANTAPAPLVLSWGRADESYAVYDHPRVLIFRRVATLSPAELRGRLEAEAARSLPSDT